MSISSWRTSLVNFFLILLAVWIIVIPQSVHATALSTLKFANTTLTAAPGEIIDLPVTLTPNGNAISLIKLDVTYDPTVFIVPNQPFTLTSNVLSTLQQPVTKKGHIEAVYSIGPILSNAITTETQIATLHLQVRKKLSNMSTNLSFGTQTQLLSVAKTDTPQENVLRSTQASTIQIMLDTQTPTVKFTTPTANSTITPNTLLTMQATAEDNFSVASVQFIVNGMTVCRAKTKPYVCSWNVPVTTNTRYVFRATAHDASGNTASDRMFVYTTK